MGYTLGCWSPGKTTRSVLDAIRFAILAALRILKVRTHSACILAPLAIC